MYQLIIIGEAVVHIDNELLTKYPYPWYKIRKISLYSILALCNITALINDRYIAVYFMLSVDL